MTAEAGRQMPGDLAAARTTRPLVIDDEFAIIPVMGLAVPAAVLAVHRCEWSVHGSLR